MANQIENRTGSLADVLYRQGMRYDLRQSQSPAMAALARAAFQQAATMGHSAALRALAHLIYEGHGDAQDKVQALLLLWSAFNRGDHEALEELADMLGSYAEAASDPRDVEAIKAAEKDIEELGRLLRRVSGYMHELVREWSQRENLD